MATKTETYLLQVVDRHSREQLTEVYERTLERREHEYDFVAEDRVKRAFLDEFEPLIKHQPALRRKLNGRDWCIDCTVV